MRKFKVIKKYENSDIALPVRSTEKSAGYDLAAAEDIVVPSIFKKNEEGELPKMKGTLIPTGVKAYCEDNEYVALHARSSLFNKKGLILANATGIIDSDYADNPDNEGHIFFNVINLNSEDVVISKGEKIGQAIFNAFQLTDDDAAKGSRLGGWGSTDK